MHISSWVACCQEYQSCGRWRSFKPCTDSRGLSIYAFQDFFRQTCLPESVIILYVFGCVTDRGMISSLQLRFLQLFCQGHWFLWTLWLFPDMLSPVKTIMRAKCQRTNICIYRAVEASGLAKEGQGGQWIEDKFRWLQTLFVPAFLI